MVTLPAVLEALLFSSPKALSVKEIAGVLKASAEYLEEPGEVDEAVLRPHEARVAAALADLAQAYVGSGRAFQLVETASGWQVSTRPEYGLWVRHLFPDLRPTRLSAPALETLAIIAYRQPITRADVEAIRGVSVEGVMTKLLDAGLVKIGGRADVPGRPLLYETTVHFLEHFGLRALDELPNAAELRHLPLPSAPPALEPGTGEIPAERAAPAAPRPAAAGEGPSETAGAVSAGASDGVPGRDAPGFP